MSKLVKTLLVSGVLSALGYLAYAMTTTWELRTEVFRDVDGVNSYSGDRKGYLEGFEFPPDAREIRFTSDVDSNQVWLSFATGPGECLKWCYEDPHPGASRRMARWPAEWQPNLVESVGCLMSQRVYVFDSKEKRCFVWKQL